MIGPDENHDHVDNNVYTNAMARWNLQIALELSGWMKNAHPREWSRLVRRIHLRSAELAHGSTRPTAFSWRTLPRPT